MNFSFINPLTDKEYEAFILNHPKVSVFHSPSWIRALSETYGFIPNCIALYNKNRIVCGVLPFFQTQSLFRKKRCVSLPFSDFCEPLFLDSEDFRSAFSELLNVGLKLNWKYVEIRGGEELFREGEKCFDNVYTHAVNLNISEEVLFDSLRPSLRRNIKKAENAGLEVLFDSSKGAMSEFVDLNALTRRKHGIPPQPELFFQKIGRYFLTCGNGFITRVRLDNKTVAAAVFIKYNRSVYYKFGASDYRFQKYRVNDLMMWKSILFCKKEDCQVLNLGRTEECHTGLLRYKRGFGCHETRIAYFRFVFMQNAFVNKSKHGFDCLVLKAFKSLPIPILKFIGQYVYKYVN